MTFVRAQALALRDYAPLFVGARRTEGLQLPADRVVVVHEGHARSGALREVPLKVLGYDPLFFRRVRRHAPVLVHAHFGPAALTALPLARWLGVPLVSTFHGYDASVADRFLVRANFSAARYTLRKRVLQREGRLFLAVSQYVRDRIVARGFPPDRVRVHYIGVDRELFSPDSSLQREALVLFVASLTEQKGGLHLLRAMREVQTRHPAVKLVVIGDGPMRAAMQDAARALRGVEFLGVQPPSVVKEWMNRATVFCVPSIRAHNGAEEGFGIVFAEAQAMGLPVVSFRTGGIGEAVADRETGLLAEAGREDELAAHITTLLDDGPVWKRMSDAARERVAAHFDLRVQTAALERLYDEVLAEGTR